MKCHNVAPLLSAYVDHELTGSEMAMVTDHLETCTRCRFEVDRLFAVKSSVARLQSLAPPDGMESRLQRAVFTRPVIGRATWAFVGVLTATSIAAAFLAVRLAGPGVTPEQPIAHERSHEFEIAADRAYLSGSDPIGGGVPAVTVSYAGGD
jgi:anti-sigma factor RsiW